MTADLRLVPHAAERDPDELAVHGPRDRLAERGLADAGRADQREHGAGAAAADDAEAAVAAPLAHRQVLDDPVLDVVEPGVVLVEDRAARRRCRRRPRSARSTGCRGSVSSQVRIQPTSGDCVRGPLQLVDLLAARPRGPSPAGRRPRRGPGSRPPRCPSPPPVSSLSSLRTAASCWRSRNSFCCFSMPSVTSLRMVSATSSSARWSLVQRIAGLQALGDVGGLKQLQLLLGGQVAAVARPGRRSPTGRRAAGSCPRPATRRAAAAWR